MNTSNLLKNIISKEISVRSREFLAPYSEHINFANIKIDGLNYRFKIIGFEGSGFGIFQPVDPTCARFVKNADVVLVSEYLQKLPRIYLILICQTNLGWCGYPFNLESAKKQFGLDCEVIVRSVSDAERFNVVSARFDGLCFWYEDIFTGADTIKAEKLREIFGTRNFSNIASLLKNIKGITPEEQKSFELAVSSWKIFQKTTTESRVRDMLLRGGAELDSYVIRGDNIEVMWRSRGGGYYSSIVQKDTLNVECAGVCLSGQDHKFHLQDLPGVIREGEEKGLIYRTLNTRHLDL